MCSIEGNLPFLDSTRKLVPKNSTCAKCKQEKANVLIGVSVPFCYACFQEYCIHKHRSALSKASCSVGKGERVLLAFSGGRNSSALLHLSREGIFTSRRRTLFWAPVLLYVDESVPLGLNREAREALRAHVIMVAKEYQWPIYMVSLEQVMQDNLSLKDIYYFDPKDNLSEYPRDLVFLEDEASKLKTLLSQCPDISFRQRLISVLRYRLMCEVAVCHGFQMLMLGECMTNLSVQILSSFAQGLGSQIQNQVAYKVMREDGITVIRPLRDFLAKEIVIYNRMHDISSPSIANESFPSTISTVFRAGEKLNSRFSESSRKHNSNDIEKNEEISVECSPESQMLEDCFKDLSVGYQESDLIKSALNSQCFLCEGVLDLCTSTAATFLADDARLLRMEHSSYGALTDSSCLSCRRLLQSLKDVTSLPPFILQHIKLA